MSRTGSKRVQPNEMAPPRRHFDPVEANRALVLVRKIVADIVNHYSRLVDLQESIDAAQADGAYDRCETAQGDLVAVAQKLQCFAEELDDIGVELKDWSAGVVDFPSIIDGREAYLCWRHGEGNIEFWHELDEGSSGRQPISELGQKVPAGS